MHVCAKYDSSLSDQEDFSSTLKLVEIGSGVGWDGDAGRATEQHLQGKTNYGTTEAPKSDPTPKLKKK